MGKDIAVFLDRDGTINEEVGYLHELKQLQLIPNAGEAIRLLNEYDMKTVVVTNQSGIARGFFDEAFVNETHDKMNEMLKADGAHIDRFYFCPHHAIYGNGTYKKICECRKPNPGMLLKAAREMNIDLARSYMIGDMTKDLQAARRAGVKKAILVKTGYGENIVTVGNASYVAHDIMDAVKWIIEDSKN